MLDHGSPRTQISLPCSLHAVAAIAFPRLLYTSGSVLAGGLRTPIIRGGIWIAVGRDLLMCPKAGDVMAVDIGLYRS